MFLEYPYDVRYAALKLAIKANPHTCADCHVKDALAYVMFLDQEADDFDDDDRDPQTGAPLPHVPGVQNRG